MNVHVTVTVVDSCVREALILPRATASHAEVQTHLVARLQPWRQLLVDGSAAAAFPKTQPKCCAYDACTGLVPSSRVHPHVRIKLIFK